MLVILDNGHGAETPGKCSPDGIIREYKWCRNLARELAKKLNNAGQKTLLLCPEEADVPLSIRVRRVNETCKMMNNDVALISIHNNAAGIGELWQEASGFSVFVYEKASQSAKRLAGIFTSHAVRMNLMGNRYIPECRYWKGNFAILRNTACPAVLTENMFMDNRQDALFLNSEEGRKDLLELHYQAIMDYVELFSKR